MSWGGVPGWRSIASGAAIVLLGAGLLGGAFILSGLYNVAASSNHFDITNFIIRLTLARSVETRSMGIEPPPDLSDERLARLGARHFALGCAPCHASPSTSQNPIAAKMYPAPPPLSHAAEEWDAEELFWIVKHGLKFTGMPAWPALERDEEVWALVAFLERLPEMEGRDYAEFSGTGGERSASALTFAPDRALEETVEMCGSCHGDARNPPVHPLAPPLAGQKEAYLRRALSEYAAGRRPSGIMEPMAAALGPSQIEAVAQHYARASLSPPGTSVDADADAAARGQAIAMNGLGEDGIPACRSCHAAETSGQFPRLDGLPAEYIATQLSLFQSGVRAGSAYSAIMAPIARRLSKEQIEDVAAYFAARSPGDGTGDTAGSEASQ
ncbi:c-type cytochrome [Chelativorans sp.]|uniref:c-type cytochrome n=1 Tax=Chelativorans sp. TaxID=2203393 RepID=UPI002811D724|nr:c-type cytochrome [Chelativorans sp.]